MHRRLSNKYGEELQLRPLRGSDASNFADFLRNLGPETRARFGPHPLDESTAHALCAAQPEAQIQRLVLCEKQAIVGYFILDFTPTEAEQQRYQQAGIGLNFQLEPRFAPCIADHYQNQGLASLAMAELISYCQQQGLKSLVLMGGTQASNLRAIHFYKKAGFAEIGRFYTAYNQQDNLDMRLSL